ncbi:hypothetical protein K9M78_00785 [Candidatus Bipolaricaulota bacterium]|nr:hypothetical protein [Candidatus Bipolaricaulota bacterium]
MPKKSSGWFKGVQNRLAAGLVDKLSNPRLLVFILLILGTGLAFWKVQNVTISATIIATGIPALYYIFQEYVKQPQIKFVNNLNNNVAPMRVDLYRDKEDNAVFERITPQIYTSIEVKNVGLASAQNCLIKVIIGDKVFHARWKRPNNPERYNLLPQENQSVHIFRTVFTTSFNLLIDIDRSKPETIESSDINRFQEKLGEGFDLGPVYPMAHFEKTYKPATLHPRPQPPAKEEESLYGGWLPKKIENGSYKVKVQAIAENYNTGEIPLGQINLPDDPANSAQHDGNWQDQWVFRMSEFDKFRQLVQSTINHFQG